MKLRPMALWPCAAASLLATACSGSSPAFTLVSPDATAITAATDTDNETPLLQVELRIEPRSAAAGDAVLVYTDATSATASPLPEADGAGTVGDDGTALVTVTLPYGTSTIAICDADCGRSLEVEVTVATPTLTITSPAADATLDGDDDTDGRPGVNPAIEVSAPELADGATLSAFLGTDTSGTPAATATVSSGTATIAPGLPAGDSTVTVCFDDCAASTTIDLSVTAPEWELPGTCVLTFDLSGGFQITNTLGGLGDTAEDIALSGGELIVRLPFDGVEADTPSDGTGGVLRLNLPQEFTVAGVLTEVTAHAGSVTEDTLNVGQLSGTDLEWVDESDAPNCIYNADTWDIDRTSWSPDTMPASGPGCLSDYSSIGVVTCGLGPLCSSGALQDGPNPQNSLWDQPLNTFQFNDDFTSFTMTGVGGPVSSDENVPTDKVEIPNAQPSRVWINYSGSRTAIVCTPPAT